MASIQVTAPAYSTVAGAISGVATWALSTYAFHGAVPQPVQVALYVLIPALVTGIASWLTKQGVITAVAAASAKQAKSAQPTSRHDDTEPWPAPPPYPTGTPEAGPPARSTVTGAPRMIPPW